MNCFVRITDRFFKLNSDLSITLIAEPHGHRGAGKCARNAIAAGGGYAGVPANNCLGDRIGPM
jgi:hypothetical protein